MDGQMDRWTAGRNGCRHLSMPMAAESKNHYKQDYIKKMGCYPLIHWSCMHHLCVKLCASFHSHQWSETWVIGRKYQIQVKVNDFMSCVTFKFDRWSWKTIGHVFYVSSTFVHHSIANGELKMELQSRNMQFGLKLAFFSMWSWNLTDVLGKQKGHPLWATSSYVHHFKAICELKLLELWCGKAQTEAKFALTSVTLTFDIWPWPLAWASLMSMVITPKNFMLTWWKQQNEKGVKSRQLDRRTDRQTEGQMEEVFS